VRALEVAAEEIVHIYLEVAAVGMVVPVVVPERPLVVLLVQVVMVRTASLS